MDALRDFLAPLTDWIPPDVRRLLDVEVWWLILLTAALLVLVVAGYSLRGVLRKLFVRRKLLHEWQEDVEVDLEACPLPSSPPGKRGLRVYDKPVRLRLVVVGLRGKTGEKDTPDLEALLDGLAPGLAAVARRDNPSVRVWPGQLSHAGFVNTFHRRTLKPEREGKPSRWVLLAGPAEVEGGRVEVGLGLWTEEPNTLGRINLERHQWRDVLRLKGTAS